MIRYILFSLIVLSPLANIFAQDSLSIERAILIGLENNFQIQISNKEAAIAANNNSWGQAGAYPSINLNAFANGAITNNVFGQPLGVTQTSVQLQPGIDLNWILFNGFRIRTTKHQLADLQLQSEGNVAIVVENTLQSILLSYYLAKLQEEALDVALEILRLSRDRYRYVQTRKSYGSAGTFDVLQAENNYLTDSSNALRQQLNYENALRNLNLVLSEPIEKQYYLRSEFDIDNNIRDFVLADLIAKLESNNKTLRNQYVYQEILKKNISINKSQWYPMLNLSMGSNYGTIGIYTENAGAANWNNGFDASARLTLTWTLSNGGNVRRAIENARIEEEIGQLQLEDMRRAMYNQLFNSLADYNIKRQLRQVAQLNVKSSRLNLDIAEEKFRSGAINSFNYRDIQIVYFNAARELLQANYNLVDSYTELLRLTGGIVTEMAGAEYE